MDVITIFPHFNVYRRDIEMNQMRLIAKDVTLFTYGDKEGALGDAYAVTFVTAAGESAFSNIAIATKPCRMCLPPKESGSTGSKSGSVAVIQRTTYGLGPQTTAVRVSGDPNLANNGLFYVHADHLGSASLTTDAQGNVVARQSYRPYGEVRSDKAVGAMPTNTGYTGQRLDETGLMYYNARYYSPKLGRFISADTIVPGSADGSGGAAATLGYDKRLALKSLTTDFHETGFLYGLNTENAFTEGYGFWFQLDQNGRQKAKYPWGPLNPQALNRYAYVLNNPLRYVDTTGHHYIVNMKYWNRRMAFIEDDILNGLKPTLEQHQEDAALWGAVIGAGVGGMSAFVNPLLGVCLGVVGAYVGSKIGSEFTNTEEQYVQDIESAISWIKMNVDEDSSTFKLNMRPAQGQYGMVELEVNGHTRIIGADAWNYLSLKLGLTTALWLDGPPAIPSQIPEVYYDTTQ